MDELKDITTPSHMRAMRGYAFGHFMNMSYLPHNMSKVKFQLSIYRHVEKALVFLIRNVELEFKPTEFSLVMGLQYYGQYIKIDNKIKSGFITRLFQGKTAQVCHIDLAKKLEIATKKDSLHDFVRLYIFFLFNCILFPQSNYSTPPFNFFSCTLIEYINLGITHGDERFHLFWLTNLILIQQYKTT